MSFNSDALLIIQELEKNFPKNLTSITEISKNKVKNETFIEMDFNCIEFDAIPYFYLEWKDKDGRNKEGINDHFSVDTLLFDDNNQTLYLIEFKSSWPKSPTNEIRFKCYESLAKLMSFWILHLKRNREDFFKIKIKYCVITRAQKNQDIHHASFVDALDVSGNYFKLRSLNGLFVEKTRIIVDPKIIFTFLSRITKVNQMKYHTHDGHPLCF